MGSMSDRDDAAAVRELAVQLAEGHRPVQKRDVMAYVEQYLVQCPACDRDTWQVWRPGDDRPVECAGWRRAVELGLVS